MSLFRSSLRKSRLALVMVTVVATLATVLLVQNWTGAEKKIEQTLPRLYESDDGEFRRSLSALLGPQIVEGNKVETLLNGDQIFPSMLAAIRGRKVNDHFRNLHLLVRQHRPRIRRRAARASPRWRSRACAA